MRKRVTTSCYGLVQQDSRECLFPQPSIYHSKVPVNEPPPGSPTGAPIETAVRLQSPLLHILQISHKIPLAKDFFLPEALGKECPSMFLTE
jgi:hypothetical protein